MSDPDQIIAWHWARGDILFWTPQKGSYGIMRGERCFVVHIDDPEVETLRARLWRTVLHGARA